MKKILKIFLALFLTITLVGCQTKTNPQIEFDAFIQQALVDELDNNYITTLSSFEHPENYGLDMDSIEASFGDVSLSDQETKEMLNGYQEKQKELKKYDRSSLSSSQQNAYDIYQTNLESKIRSLGENFAYLGSVFESGNGFHIGITATLSNLPVREEKDVEKLILLVKDVKRVFKEAIEYTQTQAEMGLLMTDIDGVIEYCSKIVSQGKNSSVLKDMIKNIEALKLDETVKQSYIEKLSIAFDDVIEGYQIVIDGLDALRDSPNNTQGFYYLENGKEYYEVLVQEMVGEEISIKEVKEEMGKMVMSHLDKGNEIYERSKDKLETFFNEQITTHYTDYHAMLEDLEKNMLKDFPIVDKMNYTIVNLDPEVTSDSIAAYFVVPPYDNTYPMRMFVNSTRVFDINQLSTFATVAHEGMPGHMYQTSYVRENIDYPYLYVQNSNSAYVEGYAKYVELLSYEYIEGVDEDIVSYVQSNDIVNTGLIILADIGIHYEGWSLEDFEDFFAQFGVELSSESCINQYKQLQANPGTFIPYYYGYYQFEKMKEKANNELGDKFNELDYHEAILKSGNAPFSMVEENVEMYIKENKE